MILLILIPAFFLLAGLVLFASMRRRELDTAVGQLSRETRKRDRGEPAVAPEVEAPTTGREIERAAALERRPPELEKVGASDLTAFVPPDPETIGVTRRQFFNRSIVLFFALGLSSFGAAVLAFLWPVPKGGFGSKIRVGKVSDLASQITAAKGFLYNAEGRMWMTNYPSSAIDKAKKVYSQPVLNSMEAGIVVVYQKCPHLGCRVPSCGTSQWFECPCHGSQYNQAGEKKGGPAPRGMDRFSTEVTDGVLNVDTGTVIQGPPIGTNTTGQEAEGPHCVGGGALMPLFASQAVLATAASAIGGVIAVVLIGGFFIAVLVNMRKGRAEVGSELELAANRKPYLSDEELEGSKLDRTLGFGLVLLIVIAVALPLYWLAEPGRQSGAVEQFKEEFISRGENIYNVKAKCSDCHGPKGVGGVKRLHAAQCQRRLRSAGRAGRPRP